MKLYKQLLPTLLIAFAFTACGEQDAEDYTPGSAQGEQVYFSKDLGSQIETSKSESSFNVTVNRVKTDDDVTIPLKVTTQDGCIYTAATNSVTFKKGETKAELTFSYSPDDIVYGTYYDIDIAIDDSTYTTAYGQSSYSFKAGLSEFVDMDGTAQWREDCMTTFYGVDNSVYDVDIQKSVVTEGVYRLKNVYTTANNPLAADEDVTVDTSNDYYMTVDASDPNYVYITGGEQGMDLGSGNIIVTSLVAYYLNKGQSLETLKAEQPDLFGTLKDGIITMPKNSMLFGETDYNSGALYQSNSKGLLAIALPGSVISDYALSFSNTGTFVDGSGSEYVCGTFSFGEDLESVKYAITDNESDIDAVADGIIDGSVESATAQKGAGDVKVAVEGTGVYYLVAVGYANDEAVTTTTSTIKFMSTKDAWNEIATGSYTYLADLWADEEGNAMTDNGLVLYQSGDGSNKYKIANWLTGTSYLEFTWDKTTNEAEVLDQYTGYTDGNYGDFFILETNKAGGEFADEPSSYYDPNTKTFHFNVIYYCSAGIFGYGEETFTIDAAGAAAKIHKSARSGFKANAKRSTKKGVKVLPHTRRR